MALGETGFYICGVHHFGPMEGILKWDCYGHAFHLNFEEMTITRLATGESKKMEADFKEGCKFLSWSAFKL